MNSKPTNAKTMWYSRLRCGPGIRGIGGDVKASRASLDIALRSSGSPSTIIDHQMWLPGIEPLACAAWRKRLKRDMTNRSRRASPTTYIVYSIKIQRATTIQAYPTASTKISLAETNEQTKTSLPLEIHSTREPTADTSSSTHKIERKLLSTRRVCLNTRYYRLELGTLKDFSQFPTPSPECQQMQDASSCQPSPPWPRSEPQCGGDLSPRYHGHRPLPPLLRFGLQYGGLHALRRHEHLP